MNYREKYFLKEVKNGRLKVSIDGTVVNPKTGRKIGWSERNGYLGVGIRDRDSNKPMNIFIHRLVFMVYKEPLKEGYEINHKDGNKQNNHASNLEQITRRENILHGHRIGLYDAGKIKSYNKQMGHKSHNSTLTKTQVMEIRLLYAEGNVTLEELGSVNKVNPVTISRIVNNKTYKYS